MKPKKHENEENLPTVSKQTAGGITGAVIGGMLGGPVGAVAGALVGNSSAKGNKPIKKAVESVRSTLRGGKGKKAVEDRRAPSIAPRQPKKIGSAAKKASSRNAKRIKKKT